MGLVLGTVAAGAALWRHRALHPWVFRVRILRALPQKARLAVVKTTRLESVLGATARLVAGETAGAEESLRRAAAGAWSRRTAAGVAAVSALHRPDLAPGDVAPPTSPRDIHATALLIRERGELTAARDLADGSRRLDSFGAIVDGELALLQGKVKGPTPVERGRERHSVVHVVTNALPDVVAGYTTRTHGIAAAQAARGEVRVSTRLGFPFVGGAVKAPHRVVRDGVRYERRLPRRGDERDAATAASAEARELVETAATARVLHAHSHHVNGSIAQAAAAALDIPWIYEVRGFLEETWIARGGNPDAEFVRASREAETRVMLSADHVVTLSQGMRDEIVSRGIDPKRVTVVPNAVSSEWLSTPEDAAAARSRLGLPSGLIVGSVSSINGYEGLDLIADVIAELRSRGIEAHGLVVGDGAALESLRGAEGVTFTGRVAPSVARDYHRAIDVFLVPRLDTSVTRLVTPIKPLEAMATGSLVIASDLPALREVVTPESGGFVLPRDAPAWAAAIESAVRSGEVRERGERGRRWVEAHRTWTSLVDVYEGAYSAANGRRIR